MSRLVRAALVAGLVAVLPAVVPFAVSPVAAHGYKIGELSLTHPWTRATPKGSMMGGGFLTIVNGGASADRLVGGNLELAGRTEVHEMKMEGDVMKMRKLDAGLDIPAGATIELKPGSYHMMFFDLKQPLEAGTMVKGSLVFEKAGTVDVEFAVEAVDGKPAAHGEGHDAMPMGGHDAGHGG